jgi:PAS domain S-box-containing protein
MATTHDPVRPEDALPGSDALLALAAVDHIPAMVAYWDRDEVCRFANHAYLAWFGRTRAELLGTTLRALLGPLYEINEPYIRRAFSGEVQVFERRIPVPDGVGFRDSLATYTPDVHDGEVRGIFVHVADSGLLKEKERELERAIEERDRAAADVRTLEGLLPICASCKSIRTETGEWATIEQYVGSRTNAEFTHGLCPACVARLYPDLD